MPLQRTDNRGYAMAALLVAIGAMSIAWSVAIPSWNHAAKREREEELIFRGEQYARAISLYQRKYANANPPGVDALVEERFLRKKYSDPMVSGGEFQLLYQVASVMVTVDAGGKRLVRTYASMSRNPEANPTGQFTQLARALRRDAGASARISIESLARSGGGIVGVVSASTHASVRLYHGRSHYNEWLFTPSAAVQMPEKPIDDGPLDSATHRVPGGDQSWLLLESIP